MLDFKKEGDAWFDAIYVIVDALISITHMLASLWYTFDNNGRRVSGLLPLSLTSRRAVTNVPSSQSNFASVAIYPPTQGLSKRCIHTPWVRITVIFLRYAYLCASPLTFTVTTLLLRVGDHYINKAVRWLGQVQPVFPSCFSPSSFSSKGVFCL